MMILAIDLGQSKSVACVYDTESHTHRFASGRQVGAYVGLAPRRYQSGSMDRQGRISRRGDALVRSLLVEVAWLGRRWNPWMKAVYERALHGTPSRKKIAETCAESAERIG